MKRIGILVDELIPGGFQKVAVMEAKYLRRHGYSVSLVVLHKSRQLGYKDIIEDNKIKVIFLSDRLPNFLKINFHIPFFAFFSLFHVIYPFYIHRYIKKNEFDVFITHGTYTAFSSISIAKNDKIPYICFVHDPISYILKQKYKGKFVGRINFLLNKLAEYLDRMIINNAEYVLSYPDMIDKMKSFNKDYQGYIPLFNASELIDRDKIQYKKQNYAITVTKWDSGKNFSFLLDVWSNLKIRIPLKVIGSFVPENLIEEYRSLIHQKGLSDVITLVGPVTESELSMYYSTAKLLVHPCREAFGMTILEAASNACPVVFTKNSGVVSVFSKKTQASLPQENDLAGYIQSIDKLTNIPLHKYVKIVKDTYNDAQKFSWDNHCRSIEALI